MKFEEFNDRGFLSGKFKDERGERCSLQESSSAMQSCIWLGIDKVVPLLFTPRATPAWTEIEMPVPIEGGHVMDMGRMHLTQAMVRKLLPALMFFAEFGHLPYEEEEDV